MTLIYSWLQPHLSALLALLTALSAVTPYQRLTAEQATVLSVSDGDTVVLQIAKNRERVRLIGIDTPESHTNPRAKRQAERNHQDLVSIIQQGKAAALYTRSLLPRGTSLRIEHDVEKRDHYGRLLAYLWLPNDEMVNEKIITSGYAYPLTIAPNIKYRDRFLTGFQRARSAKRGLWAR